MYISSYIKDPIPFLLIGGMSGIGKTEIIEALLENYPGQFEQPLSYTTRERRRDNDRYEFVTEMEIRGMEERGELANFDNAYGNYYGIASDAITKVHSSGKIPVKEIHPKNFFKFDTAGLNSVKILIENRHLGSASTPFVRRREREDDFDFEKFADCDIRINISGIDSRAAAEYLLKRVIAFRLHMRNFPHPNVVEETNRRGYDAIASEFDDDSRITTRNFHDASAAFWDRICNGLREGTGTRCLELGPGNGWLFTRRPMRDMEIDAVELSTSMKIPYAKRIYHCSARSIPVRANHYDIVVGSLIDPLLVPEAFLEIARVLKTGGRLIFTTPSWEWASRVASRDADMTVFKKIDGSTVPVYSFCDTLQSLLTAKGLAELLLVDTVNLSLGKNYSSVISPAIFEAALLAGKTPEELPIVTGIVLEKSVDSFSLHR